MLGWLKRRSEHSKIERARTDMSLYVDSLRGMEELEIAVTRVLASSVLMGIKHDGEQLKAILDGKSFDDRMAKILLANLEMSIRKAQKQNNLPIAAGLMVWVYSLRAVMFPPLRIVGQSIWKEMERGEVDFPEAMHQLQELGLDVPNGIIWEAGYVPLLLNPDRM